MKLKSIQIAGFKSFADKTIINFQKGLTGIVGPNGSGKSNVIEAVRWALGEQSAKSLRGKKMKDVIFSGSKYRHPLNRAEVSLIFDNSTHFLDSDYSEVKITRTYYRNGESIYSINDKECLLRDINNLFMDTGLGEGSLSIISQGNVDDILDDDVEKRRSIIETAAGVYRYKKQKNESKKKLEETQFNLDRISDITSEIKKQMTPLKKQSETASLYLRKKKYLSQLEYNAFNLEINQDENKKKQISNEISKLSQNCLDLNHRLTDLKSEKKNLNGSIESLNAEQEKLQQELLTNTKTLETVNSEERLYEQREQFNSQKKNDLEKRILDLKAQRDTLIIEVKKNENELVKIKNNIKNFDKSKRVSNDQKLSFEINKKEKELEKNRSDYVDLMQQITNKRNDMRLNQKLSQQSNNESAEQQRQIRAYQDQVSEIKTKIDSDEIELKELQANIYITNKQFYDINVQSDKIEKQIEDYQENWYADVRNYQEIKTERDSLQSMLESHNNLYRGTRNLLKQRNKLPGILGTVSDFISVPKEYVTAIEITLSSSIQQIIVDNVTNARNAIRFLNKNKQGIVTLLPIQEINERLLSPRILDLIKNKPGFMGIAANLVQMPNNMEKVKNHLLGNVIITDNLKHATELSKTVHHRVKFVSLNGDVINSGGSITGGKNQHQNEGILSQKNKLIKLNIQVEKKGKKLKDDELKLNQTKKINEEIQQKKNELYKLTSDLKSKLELKQKSLTLNKIEFDKNNRNIKALQIKISGSFSDNNYNEHEFNNVIKQLQIKIENNQKLNEKLKSEIDELKLKQNQSKQSLNEINQKLVVADERKRNLNQQKSNLANQLQSVNQQLSDSRNKIKELTAELNQTIKLDNVNTDNIKQSIKIIQIKIDQIKQKTKINKEKIIKIDKQISENQDETINQNEKLHQFQSQLNVISDNLKKNKNKIKDLEINYDKFSKLTLNFDEIRQKISNVKQELSELGNVNIGAIKSYEELKERYDFMQHQMNDLNVAKNQLLSIMNKMDETVKVRFEKTYQNISQVFSKVFRNIFGGGEAKLELNDPHHLLTTGIDIIVKPPGKRFRNISLLSGGEKALTALALLFAILEVKPVPFVILDEAESALDPANVDRFARYIQDLKQEIQFIVITHRKETMVYADNLYGVTMQDSGISKLVSVNLNDDKHREN
ncbi:chromosome segregation protein SMC [Fructilactobacillus lindneri]|uniref:chromosome segregation protein SMC n=1 Tax=Fructilactobacillus lindneri TaxID=53444 RepID=UPI000CD46C2F|nr:chromosome segregation protein SMC [Fructilactobacillus lindneri]POH08215.1 chromosome segregation protein SMC [Fructilactobacillus lindneri]